MINYISPFKAQTLMSGDNVAYIVPSSTVAQIRALTFHNTSASSIEIGAYLIPSNVEDTNTGQRLVTKTLGQNESYLCPEVINQVLNEGMKVVLSGQGVNAMLSVAEQSTL